MDKFDIKDLEQVSGGTGYETFKLILLLTTGGYGPYVSYEGNTRVIDYEG